MKRLILGLLPIFFVLTFCITLTYSTTWVVQVADFQFTPNNFTAFVGDSVKWQWVSGSHTTTSISVPTGAVSWNAAINSFTPTFIYRITTAGAYHYKCTPHFPGMVADFTANPLGITPISGTVPANFNLAQNYPNPFNPVTNFRIDIAKSSFVKVTVYNLLGGEVEVLVNNSLSAGSYSIDWDASRYSSGVYIYKMETESFNATKKMILIK